MNKTIKEMTHDEVRAKAEKLYDNLKSVADLLSKRKLSDRNRSFYIRKLSHVATLLSSAYQTGNRSHLNVGEHWLHIVEVQIRGMEEGEGEKIEIPKQLSEIKIGDSKETKIFQLIEKGEENAFIKYWREIVIGILLILIATILAYFIPRH